MGIDSFCELQVQRGLTAEEWVTDLVLSMEFFPTVFGLFVHCDGAHLEALLVDFSLMN